MLSVIRCPLIYSSPRSGDTTTLGPEGPIKPKNPKNLLNPHAHRRVHQGVSKKRLAIHGFPVYNKGHNKTQGKRACVLWYAGLFYFGGGCDDSALWGRIKKEKGRNRIESREAQETSLHNFIKMGNGAAMEILGIPGGFFIFQKGTYDYAKISFTGISGGMFPPGNCHGSR